MPRQIEFQGRVLEFPDDASDADIEAALSVAGPASAPSGPAAEPPPVETPENSLLRTIFGIGEQGAIGARQGISMVAGAPVDLVNNAPRLLNLLPGVDGIGPISDNPIGGSAMIDQVLATPNRAAQYVMGKPMEDRQASGSAERVANRVGQEIGASASMALPMLAAGRVAGPMGARAAASEASNPLAKLFWKGAETTAVAPAQTMFREGYYAAGGGLGAGVANEIAGNPQQGDNFGSDFTGSLIGTTLAAAGGGLTRALTSIGGTALGTPNLADDVVRQEVVDRIINNSTDLNAQYAKTGTIDTQDLVRSLREPSSAEELIPGFQANIGDRTRDPGLMAYSLNVDANTPGAATARRTGNNAAIGSAMDGLAPDGDAGAFRGALEADRTARLTQADSAVQTAAEAFDKAKATATPVMGDAAARGSSVRAALDDAHQRAKEAGAKLYEGVNSSDATVDMAGLDERFKGVTDNLSMAEERRFRPSEATIPSEFAPPVGPAEAQTGILDASGNPITRPAAAPDSAQPIKEIVGIRNALTDQAREAASAGRTNEARVLGDYVAALDGYVDESIPAGLKDQWEQARAAARDMNDRFTRPQTAIAQTLDKREGMYALNDSAVPGKFTPTDQGRVSDFRSLMKEAGTDQRVRDALNDEVLTQAKGVLDRPAALAKFMSDRNIVLSEFPDLRARLQAAGATKAALDQAEAEAKRLTRELGDPAKGVSGTGAQGQYLRFGPESNVDAMRTVLNAPDKARAAKELVQAAGGDAKALNNARAAFWNVVTDVGQNSASDSAGNRVWNGRKLRAFIDDPGNAAVAKELYADQPERLVVIDRVFRALANIDGSSKTTVTGTSGTTQTMSGKFDPALSASSVASRARSVNRGQLSPGIAVIDLAATWLRRRSAQAQARGIDLLASKAVNDPELAATLLEAYNPADWAAKRRMLLQKYGVRATQIVNLIDEAAADEQDSDTMDAIQR